MKFCYFLDDGRLHKAININKKMHIIEEMVLFRDSQPVQHIELDTEKVQKNAALERKTLACLTKRMKYTYNLLYKPIYQIYGRFHEESLHV